MAEDYPIVLTPNVSLGQANLGSLPLGLVGRIPLQSPTPLCLSPTTLPFDKQGALSDPYSHRCFTVQFSTCTLRAQTVLTQKKPGDYYGKSTHPVLRLLQYSVLHPRPLFFYTWIPLIYRSVKPHSPSLLPLSPLQRRFHHPTALSALIIPINILVLSHSPSVSQNIVASLTLIEKREEVVGSRWKILLLLQNLHIWSASFLHR